MKIKLDPLALGKKVPNIFLLYKIIIYKEVYLHLDQIHLTLGRFASTMRKLFFQNEKELCDRLRLITQEKEGVVDGDKLDEDVFAIIYKVLVYKCIIPTQHN